MNGSLKIGTWGEQEEFGVHQDEIMGNMLEVGGSANCQQWGLDMPSKPTEET